jgi:hypothetical protein
MYLNFHPKIVLVLDAALVTIACISIRRFLIRREFVRKHGCQALARSFNKDPFLRPRYDPRDHPCSEAAQNFERSVELFRIYGNTFTVEGLRKRAILTMEPENIKTILSLKFNDYVLSYRLEHFKPLLGEGIDTDGETGPRRAPRSAPALSATK